MESNASMNIIYNENNISSDQIGEEDFQPAADFQPGNEHRSSFCYHRSISASSALSNSSMRSATSPIYELSKHALDRTNDLFDSIVGYANCHDANQRTVLIIQDKKTEDWQLIFSKFKAGVRIFQHTFEELYILCTTTGMSQIMAKDSDEQIHANIVLIRQKPFKIHHKSVLLALKIAGIKTVNSIDSINSFFDPLWIMTDFKNSWEQSARYSTRYSILCTSTDGLDKIKEFPATIVSGNNNETCIRIRSTEQIGNIAALLAKASDYIVVEPQMRTLFEVHIVKIGEYVKVFKLTPQAKSMVFVEPIELSNEFKQWIEHLLIIQPQMDILGIRAHFTTEMTWRIYELESTWMELEKLMRGEMFEQIALLVLEKIEKLNESPTKAFRQTSRIRNRKSSLPSRQDGSMA